VKADLREPSRVCVKAEPFSALTVGLEIDRIAAGCARERPCARGAPHFFPLNHSSFSMLSMPASYFHAAKTVNLYWK